MKSMYKTLVMKVHVSVDLRSLSTAIIVAHPSISLSLDPFCISFMTTSKPMAGVIPAQRLTQFNPQDISTKGEA